MAKQTPQPPTSPVIVLAGEDVFQRNEYLAQIKRAVLGAGDPGMAMVRFAEGAAVVDVLDECRMPSMFAPKKLVIVDPADGLLKTPTDDDPKRMTNREVLENYVASPSDSAVLVLCCNSWLKSTRLHKALEKVGAVRWCEQLKLPRVPEWITRRAREAYDKQLEPAAAERLRDLIGADAQRLDNELAKLSLYEPENPAITLQAVDQLVGFQHEQQIWEMIDALAARDAATALRKIEELWRLDPKSNEYTATGAVIFWLLQVLKVRELLGRQLPDGAIIKEAKLWPPERGQKIIALARSWGLDGAARWSQALLEVDLANKTSVGEPLSNLEKFIVQLCAA